MRMGKAGLSITFGSKVGILLALFAISYVAGATEFPLLKVYEFKDGKVISVEAEPNSDLILPDNGNDTERYLVLQCKAPYPVQWIYSGDGIPEFITNTSVNWDVQPIEFVASAGIFRVAEYHTGSYSCKSIQNPALSMSYYLFITGQKLFTAAGGTIFFSNKDVKIRIPCSASNPKVRVTLQKLNDGFVSCPANGSISFDIKNGFTLKAAHIYQPEGEYLCIAAFQGAYKFIEYKVLSSENPTKIGASEDDAVAGTRVSSPLSSSSSSSSLSSPPPSSSSSSSSSILTSTGNRVIPVSSSSLTGVGGSLFSASFVQTADQRQPRPPPGCKSFACGRYAVCTINSLGKPYCKCEPHFQGDPYVKCEPECLANTDCPSNRVCYDNGCVDPCPEVCGPANGRVQACKVVNHMAICRYNHCNPSPCGPYSKCEDLKSQAVCSCLPGYYGAPPNCSPNPPISTKYPLSSTTSIPINLSPINTIPDSPSSPEDDRQDEMNAFECRGPSDCSPDLSCVNLKCVDPCKPNPCGRRTSCRVIDHEPICSCAPGFTKVNQNCLPTNCRSQRDCPENKSCVRNRCINPCAGYCGKNSDCIVEGHSAKCTCAPGFTGNPALGCSPIPTSTAFPTPGIVQPTIPKKCGIDMHCGRNAKCVVHNSEPMCRCEPGFSGDPQRFCYQIISSPEQSGEDRIVETQYDFQQVRPSSTQRTTTTMLTRPPPRITTTTFAPTSRPNFIRPNGSSGNICMQEEDCPKNQSCLAGSCLDPCKFFNICGENQDCIVKEHKANCICREGYPVKIYNNCYRRQNHTDHPVACVSSHCGSHSDCILTENGPTCRCKVGYYGESPNCKPDLDANIECRENYQCPELLACVNSTCVNPCINACGLLARCRVYQHRAKCFCPQGFHGDARIRCSVPLFKFNSREEDVGQASRSANQTVIEFDWDDGVFETDTEESPSADDVTLAEGEETTVLPEKEPPISVPSPSTSTQFPVKILAEKKESLARFDLDDDEYFDDSLEFST